MSRGDRPSARRVLTATAGILIAVLVVVGTLPPATLASDIAACSDLFVVNRHAGQGIWSGTPDGASANIEHQTLHQCSPPGLIELSGSFAYVNVQGPGSNDIVQVGMGDCRAPATTCVSGMHAFAGYGRNSSSPGCSGWSDRIPIAGFYAWPTGTIYQVYHTANVWKFSAGGTLLLTVGDAAICWTSNAATWFGESLDHGDAIGGTAANHFYITSTKSAQTEGGTFSLTNFNPSAACNISAGSPPYFCDLVGPSSLAIWTVR